MKRQLTLTTRIVTLCVMVVFCFLLLFGWIFKQYSDAVYEEKRVATQHVVELATTTAQRYVELARAGAGTGLAPDEAKRQALDALRAVRYGDGDYVWVNDLQPRMLMHPTNPKLDGQDLTSYADPTGKRIFVEFADVARRDGRGFVEYLWPKPGHDEPQPKISYVALVPEWQWVVGSGIYVDDVRDQLWKAALAFAAGIGVVLLITAGIATFMIRAITRPIRSATESLSSGSAQVRTASSEVATASQSLSEGATEQAASIEEISASMEEMASMTQTNAEHARHVATLAGDVATHVTEANRMMGDMGTAMTAIEHSSVKVTGIVKAIDEIAFQTNILALNAAVEAARAGEAGMGFAVVADEVRALAQRAATAARDATSLVEESLGNARQGTERLRGLTGAIAQVTGGIDQVKNIANQVSTASAEQRQGITQVSQAISQMEQVTQRTAATAEESAAASEELQAQAECAAEAVAAILQVVGGAGAGAGAPRREDGPAAHPRTARAIPFGTFDEHPRGRHAA